MQDTKSNRSSIYGKEVYYLNEYLIFYLTQIEFVIKWSLMVNK